MVLFVCFVWCFFRSPFRQASLAQHHHLLGLSCSKYSYWPCPSLSRGGVAQIALSYLPQQCACSRLLVVRKCSSCSRKNSLPTFGEGSGPCELVRRNTCALHWWLHASVKYILFMQWCHVPKNHTKPPAGILHVLTSHILSCWQGAEMLSGKELAPSQTSAGVTATQRVSGKNWGSRVEDMLRWLCTREALGQKCREEKKACFVFKPQYEKSGTLNPSLLQGSREWEDVQ